VVHGIIKQSNGHIEVCSEPDVGTTFKICLPAAAEQVAVPKALDSGQAIGGAETILLVEDEKAVRGLALQTFQSNGYQVLTAADGSDAMLVAEEFRGPIDLLITDGRQTPIVVVVSQDSRERYLVIDGHKRVAALEQLGRDTVEATVWAMSEAAAPLSRSLRSGPRESALEQGWLLAEMAQRFGYGLDELARRFDRGASWVSRRLALVELLPEAIQQQVREGKLGAQVAMKYLVPVARVDTDDCARMAAAFVAHHCDTRQAGQLYTAWRKGTRVARERVLAEPELFLKTQRQPPAAKPAAVEQIWIWRSPSCVAPAGGLPKRCRR
jgi:ParB/RepB/Spo0J family partition protein